ncbi:helix-turn-helix domain-containing protein [Paenibacillus harenae]|uniref:helix-turn-helix domain-containing protein n=1 Tax=Paenibacillus harenae TaxID=306543 RepID=UPI00048CC56B|nr:helix-turn-helix transcriptional regulator [Paenibacillus harenae]
MNIVVARMEQLRKQKGITKTHIAKRCGHSVSWYADIAKGRRRAYLDDVFLIAEAMDVQIENFFDSKLSVTLNSVQTA